MFTLPPLPPKDYILKDVNQNQRSAQEHTPLGLPRITQSNLAKFLSPVEYQEGEKLDDLKIQSITAKGQDFKSDASKAEKPEEICKKHAVEDERSSETIFKDKGPQLSFSATEAKDFGGKKRESGDVGVASCREPPPFWWKARGSEEEENGFDAVVVGKNAMQDEAEETSACEECVRWQEPPNFLETLKASACQRRRDMALIGQPFRNEACNWYYDNYPPPKLRYIHKPIA